jgi:hypothetical protein
VPFGPVALAVQVPFASTTPLVKPEKSICFRVEFHCAYTSTTPTVASPWLDCVAEGEGEGEAVGGTDGVLGAVSMGSGVLGEETDGDAVGLAGDAPGVDALLAPHAMAADIPTATTTRPTTVPTMARPLRDIAIPHPLRAVPEGSAAHVQHPD